MGATPSFPVVSSRQEHHHHVSSESSEPEYSYEVRRVIPRKHPHVKTVYNRRVKHRNYPVHPTLKYGPSILPK